MCIVDADVSRTEMLNDPKRQRNESQIREHGADKWEGKQDEDLVPLFVLLDWHVIHADYGVICSPVSGITTPILMICRHFSSCRSRAEVHAMHHPLLQKHGLQGRTIAGTFRVMVSPSFLPECAKLLPTKRVRRVSH